jgi:hypothetical protein
MQYENVKKFLKTCKVDGSPSLTLLDEFQEIYSESQLNAICKAFESYTISKQKFKGDVRNKLKELIDYSLRNLLLDQELDDLADSIISSNLLRQDE